MRAIIAALLLACFIALPADAASVRSKSDATAHGLSPKHVAKFQCVVNKIDATGYRIRYMGGYRPGSCHTGSKHPCRMALDIDQRARDVTERGFPRALSTKFARQCGLFPGSLWSYADTGHFEVPGRIGSRYAKPREPWPRVIATAPVY